MLMEENESVFDEFRRLIARQRDSCEAEEATLRSWVFSSDGRVRAQLEQQVKPLRARGETAVRPR